MSVILNGTTYSDDDFKGYGYVSRFPEGIFNDLLVEIANILVQAHGAHVIQEEGVSLPQRNALNFTGSGLTVSDVDGKTVVTIAPLVESMFDLSDWPQAISPTELGYLNGVTSNLQEQLNGITLAKIFDWPYIVTSDEVAFLEGLTGNIQAQLTELAESVGGGTGTGDGVMEAADATAEAALRAGGFNGFIVRLDLLGILPPSESVPPVINSFIIPTDSQSLVVPITQFYTSDAVGVDGWFITESSTAPNATLSNLGSLVTSRTTWATSVITSYTATTGGLRTLYAWAKDAAGNVSSFVSGTGATATSRPVTITLADAQNPVLNSITIPLTSTSLTVSLAWSATDNVGVTGWFKKEDNNTAPLLSDSPWYTTEPTQHTFQSVGAHTLYGWVRDAAGRISNSASDTCTVASTDVTRPQVQTFTAASTATSLTHAISAFTSSDDVGVTGWFITESNVAPTANLSNLASLVTSRTTWATSVITSYNITAVGGRTLYPWVTDGINVSLVYGAPVAVAVVTVPNPVTSLVATSGQLQVVTVTFTASTSSSTVSAATSYNLRWKLSTDGAGAYQTIPGFISGNMVTGLANGLTYNFIVDAVNTAGATPYGNAVNATTMAIPAAPTITSVTSSSSLNTIDMGTVSGATSYNLYWTTDGGLTAAQIVSGGTKHTSPADPYPHTGLVNGTTYRYVQTAQNLAGESGPSAIVSGTPTAADVTAPVITAFTPNTAPGSLTVTNATGSASDVGGSITHYMIRGVNTAPAHNATGNQTDAAGTSNGWQTTIAACSFSVAASATIPLYLFAKDNAPTPNVSTGYQSANVSFVGATVVFSDDFTGDGALDSAKWTTGGGGTIDKISGKLRVMGTALGNYAQTIAIALPENGIDISWNPHTLDTTLHTFVITNAAGGANSYIAIPRGAYGSPRVDIQSATGPGPIGQIVRADESWNPMAYEEDDGYGGTYWVYVTCADHNVPSGTNATFRVTLTPTRLTFYINGTLIWRSVHGVNIGTSVLLTIQKSTTTGVDVAVYADNLVVTNV